MRSEGARLLSKIELTQRQIASRLGVSRATVAMWISGQRVPSAVHRTAMRAAFGIAMSSWPNATESDWPATREEIIRVIKERSPDILEQLVRILEATDR